MKRNYYLETFKAIRCHHLKYRFFGESQDFVLDPNEVYVLMAAEQAEYGKKFIATEFSNELKIEIKTLYAMIKRLVRGGYLRQRQNPDDRRQQLLMLTDRGRSALDIFDRQNLAAFDRFRKSAPASIVADVVRYFRIIADGAGAPRIKNIRREPSFQIESRRVTRVFGFLTSEFMGTPWSALTWQILAHIHEFPEDAYPGLLAKLTGIPKNSIVRALHDLKKRKYIKFLTDTRDARKTKLILLPEGQNVLKKIESAGVQRLKVSLQGISPRLLEKLTNSFIRYTGDYPVARNQSKAFKDFEYYRVRDESELCHLRKTLLQKLLTGDAAERLPAEILTPHNLVFVLKREDFMLGFCEFKKKKGKYFCQNDWFDPRQISRVQWEDLLILFAKQI